MHNITQLKGYFGFFQMSPNIILKRHTVYMLREFLVAVENMK